MCVILRPPLIWPPLILVVLVLNRFVVHAHVGHVSAALQPRPLHATRHQRRHIPRHTSRGHTQERRRDIIGHVGGHKRVGVYWTH
jgi:hypothetical protein